MTSSSFGATFEDFYRQHHRPAVGWATVLVGRIDVAEELAHDALIRVGVRLDDLEDPTAYLRRSVVNACRSWHRSTAREDQRLEKEIASRDLAPHDAATVEVLDVLARLPYRQRAALVLKYWAGWSSREIADALDCGEVAVRVSMHRALKALRRELTPIGEDMTGEDA